MEERKNEELTFPISDTISGPGTYRGEIVKGNTKDEVPAVDTKESPEHLGHGTAKDMGTPSRAPDPFD